MEVIVNSRFQRVAPDKARLLGNSLKGLNLNQSIERLRYSDKFGSRRLLELLLKQALAIVKEKNLDETGAKIKRVEVNEAAKLKRRRLLHQGRATPIIKRRSHLKVVIEVEEAKPKSENKPKKIATLKRNNSRGKNGTKNKSS